MTPSALAAFCARSCYTLWHGNAAHASPRSLYHDTPASFIHLVHRTLHPHHSPHIATTTLLYIQRYLSSLPQPIQPSSGSEARIWCTALQVTVKQHDDRAAASRLWQGSRIEELAGGGLTVKEMVAMEKEFLKIIRWRLAVTEEGYKGWVQRLAKFKAVMESPLTPPSPTPTETTTSLPIPVSRKRSLAETEIPAGLWVRRGSAESTASTVSLSPDEEEDEEDNTDDFLDTEEDDEILTEDPLLEMMPVRKRSVTEEDAEHMRVLVAITSSRY